MLTIVVLLLKFYIFVNFSIHRKCLYLEFYIVEWLSSKQFLAVPQQKVKGPQSKRHRIPSPPLLSPYDRSFLEYLCVCLKRSEFVCGVSFVDAVANGCIYIRKQKNKEIYGQGLSSHSGTLSGPPNWRKKGEDWGS